MTTESTSTDEAGRRDASALQRGVRLHEPELVDRLEDWASPLYEVQAGEIPKMQADCLAAATEIQQIQESYGQLMARNLQLLNALGEVLEFQSAPIGPTIHDWGRWRRVVDNTPSLGPNRQVQRPAAPADGRAATQG